MSVSLKMAQQLALALLESKYLVHPDYAEAGRVLKASFEPAPQSQDSTADQLERGIPLLNNAGLYDAADYVRRLVENIKKHGG